MASDSTRLPGAPTLVETGMVVLARRGDAGLVDLKAFLARSAIEPAGFGAEHVDFALKSDDFARTGV